MIRSALIGLWVCAMTIAGCFLGLKWDFNEGVKDKGGQHGLGDTTYVKLKPLSIPVMEGGKVSGYIVCRFSYLADSATIKNTQVKPDIFIYDSAFSEIYSGRALELSKLTKENWLGLATSVKDAVNARYGSGLLHEVILEDFGYVPANEARRDLGVAIKQEFRTEAKGKTH